MDSSNQSPLNQRVIFVLASLVESTQGALWLADEAGTISAQCFLNTKPVKHTQLAPTEELVEFFRGSNWIIDLKQYKADPTKYNYLDIPECIQKLEAPWLIVPLYNQGALFGFVVIKVSQTPTSN